MKSILSVTLFLIASAVFSQSASYSDYSSRSFEGIQTENGKLFYTIYRGEPQPDTPYNYVINLFNSELERISRERVPLKRVGDLSDIEGHNDGLLFYFKNSDEGLLYYFDNNGNKKWQKSFARDKNNYNDVELVSLGDQGFVIARPDNKDNDGFRLTLYDNQQKEKWSQGQYPEKGSIDMKKVKLNGDKLAVRTHYNRGFFSSKYNKSLYVFNTSDGSLLYQSEILDQSNGGVVEDFRVNKDGSALVIGYRTKMEKEVSHLFYKGINSSGETTFDQQFDFKEDIVPDLVSDRSRDLIDEDDFPLLNFQHIRKTLDGYEIISEVYNYELEPLTTDGVSVGTSTKGTLLILDYAIIDISSTGKLSNIHRMAKPYKKIAVSGHMAGKEIYADQYFEDYQLFAYRYFEDQGPLPRMVVMNWHSNMPYFCSTSLNIDHENILNRNYLSKEVSERHSGDITEYSFKKEENQRPLETLHHNILPYHQAGKILYYDFEGGELNMEVRDLEAKMPEPQEGKIQFTGIPGREFKGLRPIDGKGYYTFYRSEAGENHTDLYVYHRLDEDMKTIGRSVLRAPNSAFFTSDVAVGNDQVMVFQDKLARAWFFYSIDDEGKVTGNNMIALDTSANQVPVGNLLLEPASNGFYMIQPYRDTALEINGYEIIRLNSDRQIRWTWSHKANTNEALQIISSGAGNGVLAVVHNQHPYSRHKEVSNSIMVINDQNGELLYEHNLYDGENSAFPEYLKIGRDKNVITAGTYFKGTNYNRKGSDGLYFLNLNKDGESTFYSKKPWSEVKAAMQVTPETGFMFSGETRVLMEDILLMPDGGYKVLGELYKKSGGTTGLGFLLGDDLSDRTFSIFDFIVFNYDSNGDLSSVYRIPKEEQNIELKGWIGRQKGLSLSLMMRRYNMFSYLKTLKTESGTQLMFTNTIDDNKRVYRSPVSNPPNGSYANAPAVYEIPEAESEMTDLDMLSKKLDKLGSDLEEAVTGTDQTFTTFNDPYQGFAVANTEEVLVYYYNPETKTLNVKLETLSAE